MTEKPIARLRTPGVLATNLDVPLHRVLYILQTRDHINPSARAGRLRLYDREAIALIRHELNAIDARREGGEND
ncbi:MAG: hypothetical protein O7G85_00580 [Planctomycetota bacterium]|nr:hypothetical protein [Planctomycetota bacterium]